MHYIPLVSYLSVAGHKKLRVFGHVYNNNNNNFLCANILEDQAQWRDKTEGLSNCVNVEQCVSR